MMTMNPSALMMMMMHGDYVVDDRTDPFAETFSASQLHKVLHPWTGPGVDIYVVEWKKSMDGNVKGCNQIMRGRTSHYDICEQGDSNDAIQTES